jgi:hypothetical protein
MRMGVLRYHNEDFEMDDRVLAHVQVILSAKMRRRESFFLSWANPGSEAGSHMVWMHESVPVHIQFSSTKLPSINRDWINSLMKDATTGTVHLAEEPAMLRAVNE